VFDDSSVVLLRFQREDAVPGGIQQILTEGCVEHSETVAIFVTLYVEKLSEIVRYLIHLRSFNFREGAEKGAIDWLSYHRQCP